MFILPGLWRCCRLCLLPAVFYVLAQAAWAQLSTEDHLADPGFWPTKEQSSRDGFVGPEACARCHGDKVAAAKATPMAGTLMLASTAAILHRHPDVGFDFQKYKYQIKTDGKGSVYSVGDEKDRLAYPLTWAFGTGRVAQSYLFKKEDGGFYESRASYFVSLGTIDFTPARALTSPVSLEEAMYRPVGQTEVERCFACHATASTIAGKFDEQHLIPGVTCEACHGPGANHVKAMDARMAGDQEATKTAIFNGARLSPGDAVDACGACHGSFWDVKLSGVKGVSTARSAPYRLVTSKCWGKGDARLTCSACHDPHQQLETRAAAYDSRCLSCHVNVVGAAVTATRPGKACPVARKDCTSCHMPKVLVPEMHADFTDHRIRIARAGETFPE